MAGDANGSGGVSLPNDQAARDDYWTIAGKRYTEFVRNVNDAIEERDADLVQLNVSTSQIELHQRILTCAW